MLVQTSSANARGKGSELSASNWKPSSSISFNLCMNFERLILPQAALLVMSGTGSLWTWHCACMSLRRSLLKWLVQVARTRSREAVGHQRNTQEPLARWSPWPTSCFYACGGGCGSMGKCVRRASCSLHHASGIIIFTGIWPHHHAFCIVHHAFCSLDHASS